MISRFSESREVTLCVDLHGHSRKMNIFMYGCENQLSSLRLREQVFPRLLWQNTPYFSFADCNFKVQKAKESTARVRAAAGPGGDTWTAMTPECASLPPPGRDVAHLQPDQQLHHGSLLRGRQLRSVPGLSFYLRPF